MQGYDLMDKGVYVTNYDRWMRIAKWLKVKTQGEGSKMPHTIITRERFYH